MCLPAALVSMLALLVLAACAGPASALEVQVVNGSGQAPQNIYLMLDKGSSSDGQLQDDVPKRLSELSGSGFSLASIEAGRLYVSYGAPVKNNEPPEAPTRYDKVELTDPGVANLTAVDFFAIPFDMQSLDSSGATVGDALAYRCHTSTILPHLRALAPTAEVTAGGQFARLLSPQLSPPSYRSMAPYLQSMSGQRIEINDTFHGKPEQAISYSGTFEANGSITLKGTLAGAPGATVQIEGASLPSGIYSGNGPYEVGGMPASIGENNAYSVIYRDLVAGFGLGYWGGRYGNNSADWLGQPDLAAARSVAEPYPTFNEYTAIIGEYSGAYGYSFNDVGPTPVTVPLDESVATLQITIDSDNGPDTPGCVGEATPGPAPGVIAPTPNSGAGRAMSGPVKVAIASSSVRLDKRGRALLALSCSGDPCKGELTLGYLHDSSAKPKHPRRARPAASRKRTATVHAVSVTAGKAEFSIAEGTTRRIWVQVTKAGLAALKAAKSHRLSVQATASVGPRAKPTLLARRSLTLLGYAPASRRRRAKRGSG